MLKFNFSLDSLCSCSPFRETAPTLTVTLGARNIMFEIIYIYATSFDQENLRRSGRKIVRRSSMNQLMNLFSSNALCLNTEKEAHEGKEGEGGHARWFDILLSPPTVPCLANQRYENKMISTNQSIRMFGMHSRESIERCDSGGHVERHFCHSLNIVLKLKQNQPKSIDSRRNGISFWRSQRRHQNKKRRQTQPSKNPNQWIESNSILLKRTRTSMGKG